MTFILDVIDLFFDRLPFFTQSILEHIYISAIPIGLSTILGMAIGILCLSKPWIEKVVMGVVNAIYTIPVIAMLGMLIPFAGIGTSNAVITLTLYALLPMVRNTLVGIKQVDRDIHEAAKGMGTTKLQMLFKIELPLAFPVIFAGFRNMVVMTIALTGVAALIGAGGLGRAVWRGITTNYVEMTFLSSVLIAVMAGGADWMLGMGEKYINFKIFGIKAKSNKLIVKEEKAV
ncbi:MULTISPECIES: ABC transporter permease [unclassified Fusibacter]|uniref:ABC transporter permease n=1 Tax=unclassified Fusibacter TaxID=2624464 RepID=UPI001A9B84DA|nr:MULTISPECIES: ABC transporter permease [unclassified Fusibacter]MCK8059972.1 ABC transporter permease [Fusibacter sp. A2]